jgi:hypothetical protein
VSSRGAEGAGLLGRERATPLAVALALVLRRKGDHALLRTMVEQIPLVVRLLLLLLLCAVGPVGIHRIYTPRVGVRVAAMPGKSSVVHSRTVQ